MLSSLHSLVLFPNASSSSSPSSCSPRSFLRGAFVTKRRQLFPVSVKRHAGQPQTATEIGDDEAELPSELPAELCRDLMPKHVAVILDGNRRWAMKHGLLTSDGHEAGARRLIDHALLSFKWGIKTFSAFAFSTENWFRPQDEVNHLMDTIERFLVSESPTFQREGIRVSIIGNTTRIPESLLRVKLEIEEATKNFRKEFILAIDYSGRYDILEACKRIAQKAKDGVIEVENVNEKLMDEELWTNCTKFSSPDLLIRTSGEQRVSNFFLWQLAYTELFFSPVLWPAFDEAAFTEALISYQRRRRRFGRRV